LVSRNAGLLASLAPPFEEELKQANGDKDIAQRVRGAIQQKLTGRRLPSRTSPLPSISVPGAGSGCKTKGPTCSVF